MICAGRPCRHRQKWALAAPQHDHRRERGEYARSHGGEDRLAAAVVPLCSASFLDLRRKLVKLGSAVDRATTDHDGLVSERGRKEGTHECRCSNQERKQQGATQRDALPDPAADRQEWDT